MFGTSIHWTTFFFLLIDTVIVLFTIHHIISYKRTGLNRFLYLGLLFVACNFTGGFLPMANFKGPYILQYIITYSAAIFMSLYVVYYLYKEYDIVVTKFHLSILNITAIIVLSFLILFIIPYFITSSIDYSRILFTLPMSIVNILIVVMFYSRISNPQNQDKFIERRVRLSLLSMSCIALLPLLTVIGDYQWLTFSVVNTAFYAISILEVDRYLYLIENKSKLIEIFSFYKQRETEILDAKIFNKNLTRREIEIAVLILSSKTYKQIGNYFFIAENTVSKHASNIFKKTKVKNRKEFNSRFNSEK